MCCNISNNIKYVGVDNPAATLFEAQYTLPHGMSYNSYIILDSSVAVLDTVERDLYPRWEANVEASLPEGASPRYLVVHHMEPDHSGSVSRAMHRWPQMRIVCSAKAADMMRAFFPECDFADRIDTVKEGDTLELGTNTLTFYAAPMVHWPEVMVSCIKEQGILFSADAFGKFGSLQYHDEWENEAARYYINIVGKYGNQVAALLRKFDSTKIHVIAPLHGPVLRGHDLTEAVSLYTCWSQYRPTERGVLVAYGSIYGGTRRAALALADELRRISSDPVYTVDLTLSDQADAVARAFRFDAMVVASPTYDGALFPCVHDFLYHLTIKNYRNRTVGIIENGSWAPVAARKIAQMLEPLPGVEILPDTITVRSAPDASTVAAIKRMARALIGRPHF